MKITNEKGESILATYIKVETDEGVHYKVLERTLWDLLESQYVQKGEYLMKATDSQVLQEIISRGLLSKEEVEELRGDLRE